MKFLAVFFVVVVSVYARAEELSKDRIIFRTNYGDIVVALYPKVAPKHTEQMFRLAERGVFDQTSFYRLEKGFVVQIENYSNKAVALSPKQTREIIQIPAEFSEIQHRRGHLSMARYDEDVNSAETSFSFMLGDAPHLDGQYTVFGEIVAGFDVLDAIEKVAVDEFNVPMNPIFIRNTLVVAEKDLSQVRLSGPLNPAIPDDPYLIFFKIFALIAFTTTVAHPFVKTFIDMFRKRRNPYPAGATTS